MMGKKCLNCGHERQPTDISPDYECPKCGAIYAKMEAALRSETPLPKNIPVETRDVVQNTKFWGRLGDFILNPRNRGALIVVAIFGFLQDPVLLNYQLFRDARGLFPVLSAGQWILNLILAYAASAFLLSLADRVRSIEWWGGFLVMAIPYIYLKSIGVYADTTQYLIAAAEGRQIGGGAAMGHVFLFFYIAGIAQFFSLIGFKFVLAIKNALLTPQNKRLSNTTVVVAQAVIQKPRSLSIAVNLLWVSLVVAMVYMLTKLSATGVLLEMDIVGLAIFFLAPLSAVAVGAFLILKIAAGKNWARIVYFVMFATNAISLLFMLVTFSQHLLIDILLGAVGVGLQSYALFLLFTQPGKDWFLDPSLMSQ